MRPASTFRRLRSQTSIDVNVAEERFPPAATSRYSIGVGVKANLDFDLSGYPVAICPQ